MVLENGAYVSVVWLQNPPVADLWWSTNHASQCLIDRLQKKPQKHSAVFCNFGKPLHNATNNCWAKNDFELPNFIFHNSKQKGCLLFDLPLKQPKSGGNHPQIHISGGFRVWLLQYKPCGFQVMDKVNQTCAQGITRQPFVFGNA